MSNSVEDAGDELLALQHLLRGAGEAHVVAGVLREEHLVAGRDALDLGADGGDDAAAATAPRGSPGGSARRASRPPRRRTRRRRSRRAARADSLVRARILQHASTILLLMAESPFVELEVGSRTVKVTNPDKVFFRARGETKLDLVQYYLAVGEGIVRVLYERPTQLKRHPDGAEGEAIYQKRVPKHRPDWIETATVTFPSGPHRRRALRHRARAGRVGRQSRARSTSTRGRRGGATSSTRTSCASTSTRSRAPASPRRSRSRRS